MTTRYRFGPFQLASAQGPLLRDGVEIRLQPKTLVLLWTLVRQAGEVVSKPALFDAVWPKRVVVETALSFQIQLLRTALGDDPKSPLYIATVHRVGFRFVAQVLSGETAAPLAATTSHPHTLIGRDQPLQQLWQAFTRSLAGQRQLVFVTGETGIGKSALIDHFVERLGSARANLLLARGQSVEHYGEGEPYLPVLEALGRLCRHEDGGPALELLRQRAPGWLSQLTSLIGAAERAELQARAAGSSSARLQRELSEVLDQICALRPLVLILEDLHWSDTASIELLAMIAQRQEPARLLLICSYRPVEAIVDRHPVNSLKLGLAARQRCEELALAPLREADAAAYLTQHFPERTDLHGLAHAVHRRSGGLPLFMVQLAALLPGLSAADIETLLPQQLRGLVELQIDALTMPEQRVLEAASVEGVEFSAACIAAVLGLPVAEAEAQCDQLVRHGRFIEDRGLLIWPDGTAGGRYAFRHALYQTVLYRRLGAGRRRHFHLGIGSRLEAAFAGREQDSAAELAVHFDVVRDLPRAVRYYQLAGQNALQRCAPQTAIAHLRRALDQLPALPASESRDRQELALQMLMGAAVIAGRGYTAPEVHAAFGRALQLCESLAEESGQAQSLWGLFLFHLIRAEFEAAQAIGDRLLALAEQRPQDPEVNLQAHLALGAVFFFRGELQAALPHFELGLELCDLPLPGSPGLHGLRVECAATASWLLWMRGHPDQAQARAEQAVRLATGDIPASSLDVALFRQCVLHRLLRDGQDGAVAEQLRRHAVDNGLIYWELAARILLAADAVRSDSERIGDMRQAIGMRRGMQVGLGAVLDLILLARAHAQLGQVEQGLQVVAEARQLIATQGERLWEAELYLVEHELRIQTGPSAMAEAGHCLTRALDISRGQGAKAWELRATMALGELRRQQGHPPPETLAALYAQFDEGLATADLVRAERMLADTRARPAA